MKRAILILVILALLVVGCGSKITEGVVYEKEHQPERTGVWFMPIIISTGKSTTIMFIPMFYHDDEDFIVKITNQDSEDEQRRTLYVPEAVYRTLSVGDYFAIEKYDASLIEDNDLVVKHRATVEEKKKYGVGSADEAPDT